jgi:hypothetical protein
MIAPRRMGRVIMPDAQGYIQPDVTREHIAEPWKTPISYITGALMATGAVSAVYLRGSVPRGLAIEGVSDIDIVYLSDSDLSPVERSAATHIANAFGFMQKVECLRLDTDTLGRIIPPRKRPPCHMMIKTQCLFLAGTDIAPAIAPFRPGLEMMSHAFDLAGEYAVLPQLFENAETDAMRTQIQHWIARRIVRAGFEITMDRAPCFTRDLYLCCAQFAVFFPDYADRMRAVLIRALNDYQGPFDDHDLVVLIRAQARNSLTDRSAPGL